MTRALLSLNAGSSSLKFGLYALEATNEPIHIAGGAIDGIGTAPWFHARTDDGTVIADRNWSDGVGLSHEALLGDLLGWARDRIGDRQLVAIGHRVVHGGTLFAAPAVIDESIMKALDALCPLAPLHQPHNLAAIRAARTLLPEVPQVACFDTAFHRHMPALATRYALPRALHDEGIRRYGFHGLSYDYIARHLRQIDPVLVRGRVIVAHLGNGASMCAMMDGRSVDTTMGFTALDGLVMGTRSGNLDPGVVLHLIERKGMTVDAVEALLYNRSGLLGVSALSSDMHVLEESDAPEAEEAKALFAFRAAREAGALCASLDGLDGLIFTAGIGEHDAAMRTRICERLSWLGVALDGAANSAHAPVISTPESVVKVCVLPTDEERMIALHTADLLGFAGE